MIQSFSQYKSVEHAKVSMKNRSRCLEGGALDELAKELAQAHYDLKEQLKTKKAKEKEQKELERIEALKAKKEKQKETKKDTPKEEDGYIGDDGFYHRGKKKK